MRVITSPPVEAATIYLKAFDPDDPSANNDVVDADLLGTDNRDGNHGDTAELSARQIDTDTDGEATVQFRVAHQPGDNHRIAASLKPTGVDWLTDDDAAPPSNTDPGTQDQVILFTGRFSPLLTVWRQLHVEVDSMAAPNATNTQTGTVQAPPMFNPLNSHAIIDIKDLESAFEFDEQHKVGRIDVSAR